MINRISIWLLIPFLLPISGSSQSQETFIRHYQLDSLVINRAVSVAEIDNGFVLTGYAGIGDSNDDVFLLKTNKSGEPLWHKIIGHSGEENGWTVKQAQDSGFVILGSTNSLGAGGMDVYLIKTDSSGNLLWSKTYGGSGEEYGWDIQVLEDGYIISAQTTSFGSGENDAYLIKVDQQGHEIWSNTYGGEKNDRIFSVQQTKDEGFVTAGITYSYDSQSPDDRDGYLLKVDSEGNEEWFKGLGGDGYDVVHGVSLCADNGYILIGYGESFSENGTRDIYLIKTDQTGTTEWRKVFNMPHQERGINGQQTSDGGYLISGFTSGDLDAILIKTDQSGESSWIKKIGELNQLEFGYLATETKDGGFILVGHQENQVNKSSKILLVKTDKSGNYK